MAVALIFTASRAAWAGAAVGGLLFVLGLRHYGLLGGGPRWGPRLAWLAGATPVLCLVVVAMLTAYATARNVSLRDQQSYADTVLYTLNLRTPPAERFKGRIPLWDAGLRMVADRPIFGIGVGRYYKDLWTYSTRREALIRPRENAHNYFLQTAAELGVTGLLALAALLGAALAAAFRAARGDRGAEPRRVAIALGAGIVAFSIASLVGHPLLLREGHLTLWPLVALALLLGRPASTAPTPSPRPARSWWRSRGWVWVMCGVVLATLPVRAVREAGSVDRSRLSFGLHGPETSPSGRPFRWSGEQATIHVPATARALTLPLRRLAPFDQTIRVILDGAIADEIRLSDYAWHTFRYLLPQREDGPTYHRIELRVTPTWTPPREERTLGVMVGEYAWS